MVTRLLKRLMLSTGRGTLRIAWALLYRGLIRLVAAYLRRADGSAGVYVARSFAFGDAVYGLSDVDLAVVVGDGSETAQRTRPERMRQRWQRLSDRVPFLGRTFEVYVHDEKVLAEAIRSSVLTYDLERAGDVRPPGGDFLAVGDGGPEWWVRRRPGLFAPLGDWQLVSGPDRRPRAAPYDEQDRRIAAWLELVVWWSYAVFACRGIAGHSDTNFSVKLVAEAARTWLWLAGHANRWQPREQVLAIAADRLPDEESSLRRALELRRRPTAAADDTLEELLPTFARLTARIAQLLVEEVQPVDHTEVRLVSDDHELALPPNPLDSLRPLVGGEPRLLPLGDWQALAWPPGRPDEAFAVVQLDPGDPHAVAAAVEATSGGPYVALPFGGVLFMPSQDWGMQRSLQCAATDPVTFAVAAGETQARFPEVPGWSARDTARRAVAEHRTWLASALRRSGEGGAPEWINPVGEGSLDPLSALGRLLTATRAALFLESIDAGKPELALSVGTAAARLAARGEVARTITEEAYGTYRACRLERTDPPQRTIRAFDELVRELPQYRV